MWRIPVALAVLVAGLAIATSIAAATRPRVAIANSTTRWFLPGTLHAGELVGCRDNGRESTARIPAPPATGSTGQDLTFAHGPPTISISRRANGATQITCGISSVVPPHGTPPYLIGKNGLALIRGRNRFATVAHVFGQPATTRPGGAGGRSCRAIWPGIGLTATFGGACARNSELLSASVSGPAWSSLSGLRIGDPVAKIPWQAPSARRLSKGHGQTSWLLASGGTSHTATLRAIIGRHGTITRLVAQLG